MKMTRAQRRNLFFGRKPRGNTTPHERRAIWEAARKVGIPTRKRPPELPTP